MEICSPADDFWTYACESFLEMARPLGLRWSADRPVRRLVVALVAAAIAASLATFWASQGQFRGW